jgi:hypothetical protein
MAIAQRSGGTGSYYVGGAGPTTVSVPAACQANDVAIAIGAANGAGWSTPTGWTAISLNTTVAGLYLGVWYRVIQATDTNWSFGNASMSSFSVILVAFTGVNVSGPIDASGTSSTASNSRSIVANAITIATGGAMWLNAMAAEYSGSAPQFSASGFTEYDNGTPAAFPAGLLWQGPMSTGATGTPTITASYGSASGQYLINYPFSLSPTPPTIINLTSVHAASVTGATGEQTRILGTAPSSSGVANLGFSDRQLENMSFRTLENGSMRLLEGSASIGTVAISAKGQSPAITGYVGTITIPVIATIAPVSAVVATGYIPIIKVTEIIGITANAATGYAASLGVADLLTASATWATGYAAPTSEKEIINAVAVASSGYAAIGSLTIGGGTYFAAAAVGATGYAAQASLTEKIGVTAISVVGNVAVVSIATAGSLTISAFAVSASGLTGAETVNIGVSPSVAAGVGFAPSMTAGPSPGVSAVSIASLTGIVVTPFVIPQQATSAAFSTGISSENLVIASGAVNASGFTAGGVIRVSLAQNAVGFTAAIGTVVDTTMVNQPAVSSIWFCAAITAIQVFNVTAPAVRAGAFPGTTTVAIVTSSPAVLATGWTGVVVAIPAPPLNTGRGVTVRMSADEFGGPRVNSHSTVDGFGNPRIVVSMPVDDIGNPHSIIVTGG